MVSKYRESVFLYYKSEMAFRTSTDSPVWPTPADRKLLNFWFDGLDVRRAGSIGGPETVHFLLRSSLDRQVLREVWRVVDVNSSGFLTRDMFYSTMRLISILLQPGFTQASPSLGLIQSCKGKLIPLPLMARWVRRRAV